MIRLAALLAQAAVIAATPLVIAWVGYAESWWGQ